MASEAKEYECGAKYWDRVATAWLGRGESTWRRYCDGLHGELLRCFWEEWGRAKGLGIVLKTDLFDEAVGEGLVGGEGPLAGTGTRIVGVDISPEIVQKAAERNPQLEAVVADVRQLPFATGVLTWCCRTRLWTTSKARRRFRRHLASFAGC